MSISLSSRDTGIYARCSCGSRMFIPTESLLRTPVLFCPCGDISPIDKPIINQLTARSIRSHVAKKRGQLYRPPKSTEEKRQEQDWFEQLA